MDLNGPAPGTGETVQFTEGSPVLLSANGTIRDEDNIGIGQMLVALTSRPDGDDVELVYLNPVPSGIFTNYDSFTGELEIYGIASGLVYQDVLRSLYYNNTSNNPALADRQIIVQVIAVDQRPSIPATNTVMITRINELPTISSIANQTIDEDTNTSALAFTIGDTETAAASLTVTAISSNTNLVPSTNIVLGGSGTNRTVMVRPSTNQNGTVTITLTVSDGAGGTNTTFTVTVTPVNDAPTITGITNRTINEDASTSAIPFTIGDAETAAASLNLTAASSNTTLVPSTNIVLGGSGANRTVVVRPATNQNGNVTITLTVSDGSLSSNTTFMVTIIPLNDPPVVQRRAPERYRRGFRVIHSFYCAIARERCSGATR